MTDMQINTSYMYINLNLQKDKFHISTALREWRVGIVKSWLPDMMYIREFLNNKKNERIKRNS